MPPLSFYSPLLSSAQANLHSVFQFPKIRFSLLTSRLIRIELSPSGEFEDRPSQVFWYRNQPKPQANINYEKSSLAIETEAFSLCFRDSPSPQVEPLISLLVKDTGQVVHMDDPNPDILPGTARTLDKSAGPVELKPGLISRAGWVLLEDTNSLIFNADGWLEPRPNLAGYQDFYWLVSGRNYLAALKDYQRVAGFPSLLPRWMLGNWWSRFWEYSQEDIQQLVMRFKREQIPLSVFIIDMDWHITRTGNACSGWTGFSWNRDLFPNPPELLQWLHDQGLHTSLNLHPAEGIHPHEDCYQQACLRLGEDPALGHQIPFDIGNPNFAQVYFEELLHPLETQGVDFWWIDWQQGQDSGQPGLDPLWWLNHLHYYNLAREGKKRSIIFSRWGGPGNHRYPIGFSGDTIVSWEALDFQPFFTAASANAAYGWWSHDIGGHMEGIEDRELYTRWVQFGILSPIFRLHSTKDIFIDRQPWAFDAETLRLTRQAMQFRHALVPYLYTMSWRNETEGAPLITPLYYDWPLEEASYMVGGQYLFGSELLAAPITSPLDPDLQKTRKLIWFPPGEWFDFFNGECFNGSSWRIRYFGLSQVPLFARAGAIVPLQTDVVENGCPNPDHLDLVVFPGRDGSFTLFEDDGISQDYHQTGGCRTEYHSIWAPSRFSVNIAPAEGHREPIPPRRTYSIQFRGVRPPDGYHLAINGNPLRAPMIYDDQSRTATLGPVEIAVQDNLNAEIYTDQDSLLAPKLSIKEAVISLLKDARMETVTKGKIYSLLEYAEQDISVLGNADLKMTENQLVALIETVTGAGIGKVTPPYGEPRLVLINPKDIPGFRCLGETQIQLGPEGTLLPNGHGLEVDYFGLLRKKV